MIDEETKKQFLKELEESGNIYRSCRKLGIDRSTFYRWKENDKGFKNEAKKAEKIGRSNNCDIGESYLMANVRKGEMKAIKYFLRFNSERYKGKETSNVVIIHKKYIPPALSFPKTLKDLIDEDEEQLNNGIIETKEKHEALDGIPPKDNYLFIPEDELIGYEEYVEEWYKKKELEQTKQPPKT